MAFSQHYTSTLATLYWWLIVWDNVKVNLLGVQCLLISLRLNIDKQSVQDVAKVPVFGNSTLLHKNNKNSEIDV